MKSLLKSLLSVAAAALALASCSNDANEEITIKGEPKTLEVNATIEQTRTTMAANHVNLEWSENDEIFLYIGENATKPNVINPLSGGTITATYNDGDNVYANYSLGNETSPQGAKQAKINIIAEQSQVKANVFAGENLPMAASGTIQNGKVNLEFKPLGCVLVFNVYGPVENEKIKSVKFETSVGCCGYKLCDLMTGASDYAANENSTSVTVTLITPASIGTAKPNDTQIGSGNQVYMVVAPVNYEDATITVTTNIGKMYTFKTANGIDCSANTARVVNLNLTKASVKPAIEVPTVPQQPLEGGELVIKNIVFKNIASGAIAKADVEVYSDAELTQRLDNPWLTFNNAATLASGQLNGQVAPNETTENRTAYIGIKCAGVQAAIAVTQVGKGTSTKKYFVKVTEGLSDWTGTYLIVYEKDALAMDSSLTANQSGNTIPVKITEQGILSDETTDASLVKILKIDGGYMLQAASGLYLYSSSDDNQLSYTAKRNTADNHPNSISIEGSGSETFVKIESHGSVLRCNATSKSFRYYSSDKYDQQKPIQLYKLQE